MTQSELTPQQIKQRAIDTLRTNLEQQRAQLADIDPRLEEYFDHLVQHSSTVKGDPNDRHNVYELLGAVKFLRLMRTYEFDKKKVRQVIYMREGTWEQQKNGSWRHTKDGMKCPGTVQPEYYRWLPFQVFTLASVFGFYGPVNTEVEATVKGELLPSEWVGDDGMVWDRRRVCQDFTLYITRKNDKSGMAAYIGTIFFSGQEDFNSEVYCVANTKEQSQDILFERTKELIKQLDPKKKYFHTTATLCDWNPLYRNVRNTKVRPISAGGKAPDGTFAHLLLKDEYGSAPYVSGKSDFSRTANTVLSSMGPRREPLTFTTTTAGTIEQGPFIQELEGLHRMLEKEIDPDATFTEAEDRIMCLLYEPDQWERDPEFLMTNRAVRFKVCPALGIMTQHAAYDNMIAKAQIDPAKLGELLSKYFNLYATAKVEKWLKPDDIRALQIPQRIDDLSGYDGWLSTCGFDFSMGDDIYAASYLCVRRQDDGSTEFFADMTCWVSEEAMKESPLRPLYEKWAAEGWLNVVPGWTFQTTLFLDRISEILEHVPVLGFGYDPYRANQPINDLTAFVTAAGADAKATIIPIRQNYATYNPLVLELDAMVRSNPPLLHFSPNPIWPWVFGNVALSVSNDGMENRKPVKASESKTCKVDPVQALCNALAVFDILDGRISK